MSAAERQRRRRSRLAGLEHAATADDLQQDRRQAEQLRAQLIDLERENQQLQQQLTRPVISPIAIAPAPRSSPAATPWLNRIVATRKR